jgi:hypothetical protein
LEFADQVHSPSAFCHAVFAVIRFTYFFSENLLKIWKLNSSGFLNRRGATEQMDAPSHGEELQRRLNDGVAGERTNKRARNDRRGMKVSSRDCVVVSLF